ncbi:hypothetical protein HGRIS_001120 [Hohenbuehelia grisea]|uniref:Uncharacterized protein n=1 Tax=Hohenbuehelia grisea TaxID=104357 RepID=A0ABR3JQI9_9AGAR
MAVQSIKELALNVPMNMQSEMTACVAVLALNDDLKGQLLEMGICEVLIPLTNSPSSEVQATVQRRSVTCRSKPTHAMRLTITWHSMMCGTSQRAACMHRYLYRFLTSSDATFQYIDHCASYGIQWYVTLIFSNARNCSWMTDAFRRRRRFSTRQ